MSCPAELRWALYADGELPPAERSAADAHLVGCRACRELVLALREEATLLAEVIQERAPAARPAPAPPARGLALGFASSLGAAAFAVAILGWTIDALRPAGFDWLSPLSLRGATDMAFDLVFLLRDEAPGLFEAAVAVAIMASVSALLTLLLGALVRRSQGPRLLLLTGLLVLALPGPGRAHFGLHEHRDYALAAGEVHQGTLVASARNVSIDGIVEGDLLVLTERLTVRGEVRGNVVAIARNLELPGRVVGSVHLVSARAHVSGAVDGNLYAAAEDLTLAATGRVGRDALALAENAVLEGRVGRDLVIGGDTVELRGPVAGDVQAWIEALYLRGGAAVGGNVEARLPDGVEVVSAPGARVKGEIRNLPQTWHRGDHGLARWTQPGFYLWLAFHVVAGLLAGLALHTVVPGLFGGRLETGGAFFRTLGLGFLAAVGAPVALALTALTIVGIPLALLGLGIFLASLYLSVLAVAALVGRSLTGARGRSWRDFSLALAAGLAIVVVAGHLPWLGGLVRLLVVASGLGLLVERGWEAWRRTPVPV